jgi:hypothetical protein|tara:strand:+ start:379 stop:573 length:195 start_codon:yes stop_codon:yes gene_type:complete
MDNRILLVKKPPAQRRQNTLPQRFASMIAVTTLSLLITTKFGGNKAADTDQHQSRHTDSINRSL